MYKKWFSALFALLVLGVLAAVPLRVCLLLYAIDPKTGFYTQGSSLVTILNVLLAVLTAVMILPVLYRKPVQIAGIPRKSVLLPVSAALLSLLMLLDSASLLLKVMFHKGGAGVFLVLLCEFLAAVFFALFARSKYTGTATDFSIAALLPSIWSILNLVVAFMNYTTISNISECLIDICKMIFVMVFFYYQMRYIGGFTERREIVGLFTSGLPAVLFCLVSTLPHYIAYILNRSKGTLPDTNGLVFISLGFYILVILAGVLRQLRSSRDTGSGTAIPGGFGAATHHPQ